MKKKNSRTNPIKEIVAGETKTDLQILKEELAILDNTELDGKEVGTWEKMLSIIKIAKILTRREIKKEEIEKEKETFVEEQRANMKKIEDDFRCQSLSL